MYAQLIDDVTGKTILSFSDVKMSKTKPVERAQQVGEELGKLAAKSGIKKAVFDRNGYRFHGRVKALAEGARSGGLDF
jgi:large subunit ribosomal protein L18